MMMKTKDPYIAEKARIESLTFPTSNYSIIFDIDGTLADCSHRLHYIQQKPRNWEAFFKACTDDVLIKDVAVMLRLMYEVGFVILLVSGRSDMVYDETCEWLEKHLIPYHHLFMRNSGDYRPDDIIKYEILTHIKLRFPPIFGVFDDRDRVVGMWRRHGLRCFQVASGSF